MPKSAFHLTVRIACIATLTLVFISCDHFKKKSNVAPVADTELQSTIDASFAALLVSDIEMMCSFVGEGDEYPKFYMHSPASDVSIPGRGESEVFRNPSGEYLFLAFNRTLCYDGHMRDGSVSMRCSNPSQQLEYYRDYGFRGEIALNEYKVDGWLIRTIPAGKPCYVSNLLSGANYNPAQTKLSWLIEGSFEFIHPSDPTKNMVWTGKLIKTLANSTDPAVFDPSKQRAIKWELGKVEYTGAASGLTAGDVPFNFNINDRIPLTRDFLCFPDKVGGLTRPSMQVWNNESHPFTSGIAEFNTADSYPRQIYYGNEGDPASQYQCDNTGVVLIKGNSYKVDFMP